MTPPQVLYVGGWGRSGSTLLSHLLGRLPEHGRRRRAALRVAGAGECQRAVRLRRALRRVPVLAGRRRGSVRRLGQDRRWTRCWGWRPLCCGTAGSRCWPRRACSRHTPSGCERYTDITRNLYSAIAAVAGRAGGRGLDQESAVCLFPAAIRRGRPAGVHLVRDSRGVVFSWMKKVVRPEVTSGDEAHFQEFSPVSAGIRWMECNLAFEFLRRLRTPTARMRYEALAGDPAGRSSAHSTSWSSRRPKKPSSSSATVRWKCSPSTRCAAIRCGLSTVANGCGSTTPGAPAWEPRPGGPSPWSPGRCC